jgi:hypothetical protein
MSRIGKSTEPESRLVFPKAVGAEGEQGVIANAMEFLFGVMKTLQIQRVMMFEQFCEFTGK